MVEAEIGRRSPMPKKPRPVSDHLAAVAKDYERYVKLARLAELPTEAELEAQEQLAPGVVPVGLCIRTR
jgi:hypothetical protein